MNRAVVVGGGVSGIVAAVLLKKKFGDVVIVESEMACGGLLKSVRDDAGLYYDQGTHIPDITGNEQIDEILFGDRVSRNDHWYHIPFLKSGNFFNQRWNLETQTLNIADLDPKTQYQIEHYILNEKHNDNTDTLGTYLSGRFGDVALRKVFEPIFQKLYGSSISIDDLVAEIGGGRFFLFGLDRVIAFSKEKSTLLKQDPFFNSKLAFHTQAEFLDYLDTAGNNHGYIYPKGGYGIGNMINHTVEKMKTSGVSIKNNTTVSSIISEHDCIKAIVLSDGDVLDVDYVFWSIPPALGLRAAGFDLPKIKFETRCSNIFHYCFDQPIKNTSSHFLWSWDYRDPIFRITLYDNFRPTPKHDHHQISVECLCSLDQIDDLSSEQIHQNLIEIGLVSQDTNILSKTEQRLKNTFPVPSHAFKKASEICYKDLTESFRNIDVSGRFSGKVWLQSDVLLHTFELIDNIEVINL
jgi:protoporphyrinogen oxidase